jgi:hypothetical protein
MAVHGTAEPRLPVPLVVTSGIFDGGIFDPILFDIFSVVAPLTGEVRGQASTQELAAHTSVQDFHVDITLVGGA